MSELTQALIGADIALGAIAALRWAAVILNEREDRAALARFEQELRDHPPNTAYSTRPILSGTLHE